MAPPALTPLTLTTKSSTLSEKKGKKFTCRKKVMNPETDMTKDNNMRGLKTG